MKQKKIVITKNKNIVNYNSLVPIILVNSYLFLYPVIFKNVLHYNLSQIKKYIKHYILW